MSNMFMASERVPDPCVLVIFGASGDLTRRKLVPAIWHLAQQGRLPDAFALVGVARRELDGEAFRQQMAEALVESVGAVDQAELNVFLSKLSYMAGSPNDRSTYAELRRRLEQVDVERGTQGNRCFYCSVPPQVYGAIADQMGAAGLNRENEEGQGWSRLIVEKPFGDDFESARALNDTLHDTFAEHQIYRIDHYLGKETLLLDCFLGDGTLYSSSDWIEKSWDLLMPIIEAWESKSASRMPTYASGSWGPKEANALFNRDWMRWEEP